MQQPEVMVAPSAMARFPVRLLEELAEREHPIVVLVVHVVDYVHILADKGTGHCGNARVTDMWRTTTA